MVTKLNATLFDRKGCFELPKAILPAADGVANHPEVPQRP
jgi:hypothetical protein